MTARAKTGKAVIDGVPQYTSVSALNSFSACERQWWFRYVEGLPGKPETESQKIGIAGHARLEHYMRTGQDVLSPLERKALDWIPKPGADLLVEHPIHGDGPRLTFDGIPMVGFIDLLDPRDARALKIIDWKFRGDVERYGTKQGDLTSMAKDSGRQMVGYAAWAREAFPNADTALLAHGQFQTKGRQSFLPSTARIDLDDAREKWSNWARGTGPKLKEVAKEKSYLRVLPTYTACGAYGGCAYQGICHDAGARLAAGLFPRGGETMGLIKKDAPAAQTATPFPPPTAPTTAAEAPSSPPTAAVPQGILPPDAPASKPELASKSPQPAVSAKTDPPTPANSEAPPAVDSPPGAKKRGKKVESDVVRPPVPIEDAFKAVEKITRGFGIHLYFRCSPLGVPTNTLHAFMLECQTRLCEKAQIQQFDIRAVSTQDLGFGKWKAFLGGLAQEAITAEVSNIRLPPGHYLVTEGDDRIQCIAEALVGVLPAGSVVLG